MKQIFIFLIGLLCAANGNAQLILNEVYTDPNSGKSEFFELYNTSGLPESTDNYTLVTYYKFSNVNKGFYVLDMPAATVPSKNFFVGSALNPFNYQGVTNSGNTNFSWNDNSYLTSNSGNLTAWKYANNDLADGNADYDKTSIAGNFNDLFNRLSGTGASYVIFLYKNGKLVNALLGGTGGQTTLPNEIASLPPLNIDMMGSAPDFTIDFSALTNIPMETCTEAAGSDNGYIRTSDGVCGAWTKSSSGSTHTPMSTNGALTTSTVGSVSVSASIQRGNAAAGSIVIYSITSAPTYMLPVQLTFYIDNGTTAGQWDPNDTWLFVDTLEATNITYSKNFMPYDANLLVVTKAASGCLDNLRALTNVAAMVLASNFVNVKGYISERKPVLEWIVAENEKVKSFEIETSSDGTHFNILNKKYVTGRSGLEGYSFSVGEELHDITYYRIKLIATDNSIVYSKTIMLKAGTASESKLTLLQNPVTSGIHFTYSTDKANTATINIYNGLGMKLTTSKVNMQKGMNTMEISLDGRFASGALILEILNSDDRSVVKLIKH